MTVNKGEGNAEGKLGIQLSKLKQYKRKQYS